MMLDLFQDNAGISKLTEILKICTCSFVALGFQTLFHSDTFLVFFIFFCFCFMSNKSYLVLLNFTRYLCSANTFFLLMRNVRDEI